MAGEYEQFDDADEARLTRLLDEAHDAPALRAEFVRELASKLDAGFIAARSKSIECNGAASHAMNGMAPSKVVASPQVVGGMRTEVPRRRRHWIAAIAAAASLMMAVAVWADPPAWAAMIRAIVRGIGEIRGVEVSGPIISANEPAGTASQESTRAGRVPRETAELEAPVEITSRSVLQPRSDTPERQLRTDAVAPTISADAPPWEPQAQDRLAETIDEQLAAAWLADGIRPVGSSSDSEFVRRVYLDLTGRVPTVSEVHEFLNDPSPDRRERLVDRLLAHRDHATHLAAVWRQILIPDDVDLSRYGGAAKFEEWLAERFSANVPYDQIVRDLLLAEGRVAESGPLLFYAALRLNPEELAARSSRAFLGVRMECAQCHDHPFDESMSQHDFWSFAAFFARISRPRGQMEMTSPVLAVRDSQAGEVMLPDSNEVVPPKLPATSASVEESAAGRSRREQLAAWLTSPNNGHFARATVNRVWSQLFGRGLVEPVDDMRPENAPIAPQVLDTLSRDFAASNFDLRRLLRSIALSKTYQLSSQSADDDPARALCFAQMNVKSFTAEQLYDCISVATQRSVSMAGPPGEGALLRFADMDRELFLQHFRAPPGQATDYQAGIPQALTLMHGGLISSATDLTTSGILQSLAAPFFNDEQRLDVLFLSTLSRYPQPDEREMMMNRISSAKSDGENQQVFGDILWALLNSAEFTLNH